MTVELLEGATELLSIETEGLPVRVIGLPERVAVIVAHPLVERVPVELIEGPTELLTLTVLVVTAEELPPEFVERGEGLTTVPVAAALVEMLCVPSAVELTDRDTTPEVVILGEGVGLPVVTDGLINGVCECVVQVVGLEDREPVVERVPTAVFELLLLTKADPLEERSPERVFETRAEALRLL